MNEEAVKSFETGRIWAIRFGGAVYIGVVLLFLAFYETLMVKQFEGNAFFMIIARIGAFLVSANSIALPIALHFWTVSRGHKAVAIVFYAGDILLMALNVLSAVQNIMMPDWVVAYRAYAPASIIYVLFGWALLFMTDPGQKALIDLQESILKTQVKILQRVLEHLNSEAGLAGVIEPVAQKLGARIFNERRLIGENRALSVPETGDTKQDDLKEMVAQMVAQALQNVTPSQPNSDTKTAEAVTPKPESHTKVTPLAQPEEVGRPPVPFGKNGHE